MPRKKASEPASELRKLAFSVEEIAKATSVSVWTVRHAIDNGQLEAVRVGRGTRRRTFIVTERALSKWLKLDDASNSTLAVDKT